MNAQYVRPTCRTTWLQWVRLLDVEEASEVLDALQDERVVVLPGRCCSPLANSPDFRSVSWLPQGVSTAWPLGEVGAGGSGACEKEQGLAVVQVNYIRHTCS